MNSSTLPVRDIRGDNRDFVATTAAVADPIAVSWDAIFAGSAGAAALSLVLLILGVGLGLSSVSPWSGQGVSATTFGVSTIAWLTFTQLAASGMGGYLAGRLRTRWAGTHTDEVYFRDTAHGFLAWAIASLVTAAMLSSAVGSIVGGGARAGAAVAGGAAGTVAAVAAPAAAAATGSRGIPGQDYFMDSLFRRDAAVTAGADAGSASSTAAASSGATAAAANSGANDPGRSTAEAGRIFANGIAGGSLPAEDTKYVGQLIAQRTGLPQAATYGGRRRDLI